MRVDTGKKLVLYDNWKLVRNHRLHYHPAQCNKKLFIVIAVPNVSKLSWIGILRRLGTYAKRIVNPTSKIEVSRYVSIKSKKRVSVLDKDLFKLLGKFDL